MSLAAGQPKFVAGAKAEADYNNEAHRIEAVIYIA
jgi:hypothetical protein